LKIQELNSEYINDKLILVFLELLN